MDGVRFREILTRAAEPELLQEIRIRAGQPVFVLVDGVERALFADGTLGEISGPGEVVRGDMELIRAILEAASGHSLYAFEEEIRRGFLTIPGGHRIGLCGRAVFSGREVRTVRDVSGLNIRMAHEKKGCGEGILKWLYQDGRILNTLLISPPGAGKTTLLRDLIRLASDGNCFGEGAAVSVVDERSEIGACFQGKPQCDLGMRTDVMDGCPKALGMEMMIRAMAPRILAVDEIGAKEDFEAMRYVMNCGCRVLATVHGESVKELRQKPVLREMAAEHVFARYVVLTSAPRPGTVAGIYDEELRRVDVG